ncbi:transmembrane protein 179-like [Gigantopelta aegis]|uniref:transmembrane protein 179-like n=1 Tax=Gigantopelta aegis TaxID=1735272 RepID=UPI001B88B682|nr:transmembrane protein 179-like [Gigantopelta aegis]
MGLGNIMVLGQVIAFLMSFIFSFFIFVPISVNLNEFNGNCLLYASGTWNTSKGSSYLTGISWGPSSACNFSVFVGVVVMLLSCFYIVWHSMYLCRGIDSSWLAAFLTCILCIVISIILFASALTVSVGFKEWCHLLTLPEAQIESCEDGQYLIFLPPTLKIDTSQYYTEMEMAQFGLWTTWICWVIVSMMSVIRMYSFNREEAFLTSMDRERQRLLQRWQPSSQYEQI